MIRPEQVHEALKVIVKNKDKKSLNYAVAYAQRGLEMCSPDILTHQVLYVLSNVSAWRGEEARKTKEILRQYVKEN